MRRIFHHNIPHHIHLITCFSLFSSTVLFFLFIIIADSGNSFVTDSITFRTIFWVSFSLFILGVITSIFLFIYDLTQYHNLSKNVFLCHTILNLYPLLLLFVVSGGNISNVAHLLACPITMFPFFS